MGHVTLAAETRNASNHLVRKPEGRRPHPGGMIILKFILRNGCCEDVDWIYLA